jgi:hypothetical protein
MGSPEKLSTDELRDAVGSVWLAGGNGGRSSRVIGFQSWQFWQFL